MAADEPLILDLRAIAAIAAEEDMRRELLLAAAPGVAAARSAAPFRTGEGSDSIHADAVLDGAQWTVRVSWDQLHYYMSFHESGTRYLPARPFLVPAFD